MLNNIYKILPAPTKLSKYVRSYIVANESNDMDFISTAKSTGCNYLGWVIDGQARATTNDFEKELLRDDWHISGQIFNNEIMLHYTGSIKHILVEFTALGLYQLLGIKGIQVTNDLTPPLELNLDLRTICNDVTKEAANFPIEDLDTRLTLLEQALVARIPSELSVPNYLVAAVQKLEEKNGAIKISDLTESLDITERQLNRKFTELVGISPKYYAKVLQVNKALHAVMTDEKVYLTDIAQAAGFYDQAHFVNVMQNFFSSTPTEFFQSDEHMLFQFLGRLRND